jgi:hypothetical protein
MRRLLAPAALLLAACATPYQPMGYSGGYSESKTAPGEYAVRVKVNGYTSGATAEAYFHRRAMELCQAEGFTGYDHDVRNGADTYSEPASYTARTSGNTTQVQQTGGGTVRKAWVSGAVKCKGSAAAVAK